MEIINSNNKAVSDARLSTNLSVNFRNERFSISSGAIRKFNFKAGKYVHFIIDGNSLFFYVNDDKSGMKLFQSKNSIRIYGANLGIIRVLKERLLIYVPKLDGTYPLRKWITNINENETYSIALNKKLKK